MVKHGHGHRHLHAKKQKDMFDYLLYFFVVATPMFELAQAWQIYSTKSAGDVSLATWAFFLCASVVWWIYAVRNRLTPLVVAYSLFFVMESAIVIGILKYS